MKVYLCGPISDCSNDECNSWRNYISERVPDCINPMTRDCRGKKMTTDICKFIVEGDKADIIHSNVLLYNFTKHSSGSPMELLYAFTNCKNTVTISNGLKLSPWVMYHSFAIVPDLDSAVEYLLDLKQRGKTLELNFDSSWVNSNF